MPSDDRQAATVYIKAIPVITLIGGELPTLRAAKADVNSTVTEVAPTAQTPSTPVERAQYLADRLQTLASTLNPADISVRWDNRRQGFLISWGKEDLIKIDSQAILPDTTANQAEERPADS
ncbi:MAG: hypothetical protein LVS60_12305 [Nodosilinea sp. LVE1205-7]|jgi:rare lipoprotein A